MISVPSCHAVKTDNLRSTACSVFGAEHAKDGQRLLGGCLDPCQHYEPTMKLMLQLMMGIASKARWCVARSVGESICRSSRDFDGRMKNSPRRPFKIPRV